LFEVSRFKERARQWDLAKAIYGDAKEKKGSKTPSKKVVSGQKPVTKTPSKAANTEPLRERRSCRVDRVDYAKFERVDYQENSSQEEQNSQKSWIQ
jgi:hypothetical protein